MNKTIVIAGATGLIGKLLAKTLTARGYEIVVICRDITSAKRSLPQAKEYVLWTDKENLKNAINGAYGVINLAGSPLVGKRWTNVYKKVLYDSRIETTHSIVDAIQNVKTKPNVLINGSAIGYYGMVSQSTPYDETSPPGSDFLAKICSAWEAEAKKAKRYGVRVVCIRTAVVLNRQEGALPRMITPFFFWLGGPIGSGKQWFPWIHSVDEVGIICFALEHERVTGAINAVAPEVVTSKQFATTLGNVLHKPSLIPVPSTILSLLFGEAASVVTTGVLVSSQRISSLGYTFTYPSLQQALQNILK